MRRKTNQSLSQAAIALLSAIAANTFLGLPTPAQTIPRSGDSSARCVPSSTHANRSSASSSASGQAPRPANNSNVPEYPNQSDPRAGVNPSSTTTGTPVSRGDVTEGTTSQNATQSNRQMNVKCPPGMVPSGKNQSQSQPAGTDRNNIPREQHAPNPNQNSDR